MAVTMTLARPAVAQDMPEHLAEARERKMHGVVLGLAALDAIGIAIHELDKDDDEEERLPGECLAVLPTPSAVVQLYDPGCLEGRFDAADHLPLGCAEAEQSLGRLMSNFSPSCLHEEGWRTMD